MMDGPLPFTGRLVALRDGPLGRTGRVSVRGAQVEVALDLVPGAAAGDCVLVQAGVALALVREREEG
jgi:hydrogenase maturation factor